jgi:2-hydroxychromene-2-carboxylate isomerase
MAKKTWKVFWDLQCPFSRKNWEKLPEIKKRLGDDFEFQINLTSLNFHWQAFPAQCAANLIGQKKGPEAKQKFVDACFVNQERYMNAALGDAKPSEVDKIFASIAKDAGLFDDTDFTEAVFLSKVRDWEMAVKPAYTEHKVALDHGVYGTPKHVIEEKLIADTESAWGPEEWEEKLKAL